MDWFLCDNGLRHERVNIKSEIGDDPKKTAGSQFCIFCPMKSICSRIYLRSYFIIKEKRMLMILKVTMSNEDQLYEHRNYVSSK